MKKYTLLALGLMILASCSHEENTFNLDVNEIRLLDGVTNYAFDKTCEDVSEVLPIRVGKVGSPASATSYSMSIDTDASTAQEGIHYSFPSATGQIETGKYISEFEILVNSNNYAPDESVQLVLNLESSAASVGEGYETVTYTISAACTSDIAGEVDFTHTALSGSEYSGTATISPKGSSGGEYTISDFSYGIYPELVGGGVPTGSLTLIADCCSMSYTGSDNETGSLWSIDSIIESGGSVLTYTWSTDFSQQAIGGTVSLTRKDGLNWPKFSL